MSTKLSNKGEDKTHNDESMWDKAAKDAELEANKLMLQVKRLQQAARIFKANKRDGVLWPSSEAKI
jgi:hypothetical protein